MRTPATFSSRAYRSLTVAALLRAVSVSERYERRRPEVPQP